MYKTVKAGFWPWLPDETPETLSSCSHFAQRGVQGKAEIAPPVLKVQESVFRIQNSWFRIRGSRFRVQGLGSWIQGSGFRVQG